MKLFSKIGLVVLLLIGMAFASDCDTTVFDGAKVLGGRLPEVQHAIDMLNTQGVEAKVLTLSSLLDNLDKSVMTIVKSCPAWQAPNGGPKSNLIVIAVAPAFHKSGLFLGTAVDSALGGARILSYRTDVMIPHFRTGDWAGGITETLSRMTARMAEFKNQANTPVNNTVVNEASQPTDFSGLWRLLEILAGLGLTGLLVFLWFYGKKTAKENKDRCRSAQLDAIEAKNTASSRLSDLTAKLNSFHDKLEDNPGVAAASAMEEQATASIAALSNSINNDPSDGSLSEGEYRHIASLYNSIASTLTAANRYMQSPKEDPYAHKTVSYTEPAPIPTPPAATSTTAVVEKHYHDHTTVVHEDSGNLVTGILIGEELNRQREPERTREPEHWSEPDKNDDFSKNSGSDSFSSSDSFGSSSGSDSSSSSSDFSSNSGSDSF